jgi:hypothetical protein
MVIFKVKMIVFRLKDKLMEQLSKTKKKRHELIHRIEKTLDEVTRYKELS